MGDFTVPAVSQKVAGKTANDDLQISKSMRLPSCSSAIVTLGGDRLVHDYVRTVQVRAFHNRQCMFGVDIKLGRCVAAALYVSRRPWRR